MPDTTALAEGALPAEQPRVRISSPASLLAVIPPLLGFEPSEPSLVVVGTEPPRAQVRITLRFDIPDPGLAAAVADSAISYLAANCITTAAALTRRGALSSAACSTPRATAGTPRACSPPSRPSANSRPPTASPRSSPGASMRSWTATPGPHSLWISHLDHPCRPTDRCALPHARPTKALVMRASA